MSFLGHGHRLFKQHIKQSSSSPLLLGKQESVPDLSENLRFANDHRIESACYTKQMFYRRLILINVKVVVEFTLGYMKPFLQKSANIMFALMQTINYRIYFRPIAGGYNYTFQNTSRCFQLPQSFRQII